MLLSPCCSQGKCGSGSQTCLLRKSFGAGTAPFQPHHHTPWAAKPLFKALVSRGRALRQHLGNRWLGWTFGKVQPMPRLTPGSRDKHKVNKEGKRKAVTNTPAHTVAIEEASWPGGSPLLKTAAASALFNQKPGGSKEQRGSGLTPLPQNLHRGTGSSGWKEALKELPDPLQGAL